VSAASSSAVAAAACAAAATIYSTKHLNKNENFGGHGIRTHLSPHPLLMSYTSRLFVAIFFDDK
jgi:hypothetical protein